MTPETSTTIITSGFAVVAYKLLEKLAGVIWRKASGTDYMTRKDCAAQHLLQEKDFVTRKACEDCQREAEDGLTGLRKEVMQEMALIRGLLLAVAVKMQIPEAEWQKLVK